MPPKPFVPQNHERLKHEHKKLLSTYKSQEAVATAMTKEMGSIGDAKMHQSRISTLLSGDASLGILELLVMAKLFKLPPHELLKPELQEYCEESESISVKIFPTESESDAYLTDLESDGRILAFSQFPSYLFQADSQPLRQTQFSLPTFENCEYYTLDAFINFLFSVSSRISLPERVAILTRYIDYFNITKKGNLHKKHIVFFSRHTYPTLSRFANMEFFPKKGLIIVLAPILQEDDGDIFLEIRNSQLCNQISEFYSEKIEPFANPMNLLRAGRRTLQQRLDGIPLEDAIHLFYRECIASMPDSPDPETVLENFSPEVRRILQQS